MKSYQYLIKIKSSLRFKTISEGKERPGKIKVGGFEPRVRAVIQSTPGKMRRRENIGIFIKNIIILSNIIEEALCLRARGGTRACNVMPS